MFNFTHNVYSQYIIVSSDNGVYLIDGRAPPIHILDYNNVNELCLLNDAFSLFICKNSELHYIDIRRPEIINFCKCPFEVKALNCNNSHMALVSTSDTLYSFELPYIPNSYTEHIPVFNSFNIRPQFQNKNIIYPDGDERIYSIDPFTSNTYSIKLELSTPVFSVASSESEIAVSFEDDIYVYSSFPFEDNLVRTPYLSLEEEDVPQETWQIQETSITPESGECTYEKYGYCDQQVYVCLDCMKNSSHLFGICEECAKICHQGHDVQPIGIRRRFRCDCGNLLCGRHCSTMMQPKTITNTYNEYGHNFEQRWCYCDKTETGSMIQCICCSDWFHTDCIGLFPKESELNVDDFPTLRNMIFICRNCVSSRLKFVQNIPIGKPSEILQDLITIVSSEKHYQRL